MNSVVNLKNKMGVIIMKALILGAGCPKCQKLEELTKKAIEEAGIDVEVEKITDIKRISQFGVMMTPALVIDGEVKCSGKIPTVEGIKEWLK